jgi:hypothetical protein
VGERKKKKKVEGVMRLPDFFFAFQLPVAAPLVPSSCSCCASNRPHAAAGPVGHTDW